MVKAEQTLLANRLKFDMDEGILSFSYVPRFLRHCDCLMQKLLLSVVPTHSQAALRRYRSTNQQYNIHDRSPKHCEDLKVVCSYRSASFTSVFLLIEVA